MHGHRADKENGTALTVQKRRRIVGILVGVIAAALVAWAFVPKPIKVEQGRVQRGILRVTVDEEAETRVHDRFEIASPVTGRLQRIELHAADRVQVGQLLAQIEPLPLDPRERAELLARVESAQASEREAQALVERTRTEHEQAIRNRERAIKLGTTGVISREQVELAETAEASSQKRWKLPNSKPVLPLMKSRLPRPVSLPWRLSMEAGRAW